jgi:zinc protease
VTVRRGVLALLVTSACSFAPRPPPAPPRTPAPGPAIATRTLANGLRVVVVTDPHATDVQVTTQYQVGAVDDLRRYGLAHLVEHLMYQQILDGEPVFTRLEDRATYFNAATSMDTTTYVARAPAHELDLLLSIEAVRLEQRCATITAQAFEREREVVINELRQRDDASEVFRALYAALYPAGHPYLRDIGGTLDSVGAATLEDACAFMDAHYTPERAVLVLTGDLPAPAVDAALAQLAAGIARRAGAPATTIAPFPPVPRYSEVPVAIDDDVFVLAWQLPLDPELQTKVRAVAAALPRLVDAEIAGSVVSVELGDRGAPFFALAVVPGDGETYQQAAEGARRAVESLPAIFQTASPTDFDDVVFDRIRQGAIYNLYSSLDGGTDRDSYLAAHVFAGRDPAAALAADLRALRALTRQEGAWIATTYLTSNSATGLTLRASAARKRGTPLTLRAPIHDMGPRRKPPDPALARAPAADDPAPAPAVPRTRVLANGLRVVLLPATTASPVFDARLIFRAGTANEPAGRRGIALLAAHTLTWDLRYLGDLVAFARAGGMRDTDVGTDRTTFSVQGLDTSLDVVLAGLRRWVREGTYDDSAATFVTAMRRAGKRVDDDGPLTDAWRAALFGPDHPYVRAGIVRHADVAVTLADVAGFRAASYTPDNATLVVTGQFDPALADRWIDFLFADWQGRATATTAVESAPQPLSIARADDIAMVQVRVAIPATGADRARALVAAAMLDEITDDVRHRLGASYTLDAELVEARQASFFAIAGWVDATRTAEAIQLIRDRLRELATDPDAAARAFVIARGHVLARLRARAASAGGLAARVEKDVELAREPMSGRATAAAVQALTIAEMTETLAGLDLARATMMMNGPAAQVDRAYAVLGRTPTYVPPATATTGGPGTTPPAFAAPEQRVRPADVEPALTVRARPLVMVSFVLGGSGAVFGEGDADSDLVPSGVSFALGAGWRFARYRAIGGLVTLSRLTDRVDADSELELMPINLAAVFHNDTQGDVWFEVFAGVHFERMGLTGFMPEWRDAAPVLGVQLGHDTVKLGDNMFGPAVRFESTVLGDTKYTSLSLALGFRR